MQQAFMPLQRTFSAIPRLQQPYVLIYQLAPAAGGCLLQLHRVGWRPLCDSLLVPLAAKDGYGLLQYLYEHAVPPENWRDVIADCLPCYGRQGCCQKGGAAYGK